MNQVLAEVWEEGCQIKEKNTGHPVRFEFQVNNKYLFKYMGPKLCMWHSYKNLFAVYLKFTFNWAALCILWSKQLWSWVKRPQIQSEICHQLSVLRRVTSSLWASVLFLRHKNLPILQFSAMLNWITDHLMLVITISSQCLQRAFLIKWSVLSGRERRIQETQLCLWTNCSLGGNCRQVDNGCRLVCLLW